jgi:hypothetical protein
MRPAPEEPVRDDAREEKEHQRQIGEAYAIERAAEASPHDPEWDGMLAKHVGWAREEVRRLRSSSPAAHGELLASLTRAVRGYQAREAAAWREDWRRREEARVGELGGTVRPLPKPGQLVDPVKLAANHRWQSEKGSSDETR